MKIDVSKAKDDDVYQVIRYMIDNFGSSRILYDIRYMTKGKAYREGYLTKQCVHNVHNVNDFN